jgi:hypothetical protein
MPSISARRHAAILRAAPRRHPARSEAESQDDMDFARGEAASQDPPQWKRARPRTPNPAGCLGD